MCYTNTTNSDKKVSLLEKKFLVLWVDLKQLKKANTAYGP